MGDRDLCKILYVQCFETKDNASFYNGGFIDGISQSSAIHTEEGILNSNPHCGEVYRWNHQYIKNTPDKTQLL